MQIQVSSSVCLGEFVNEQGAAVADAAQPNDEAKSENKYHCLNFQNCLNFGLFVLVISKGLTTSFTQGGTDESIYLYNTLQHICYFVDFYFTLTRSQNELFTEVKDF